MPDGNAAPLPLREGARPLTTDIAPQSQIDQIPDAASHEATRALVTAWPNVIKRASMRAPGGTVGLFLSDKEAQGPPEAFLLGTEFAHLHPLPDGSLHMVLPPAVGRTAIEKGWAIAHPMAGQPTVSSCTVMIFAPRNAAERAVVASLLRTAELYARGRQTQTG
jgi:Luciferase